MPIPEDPEIQSVFRSLDDDVQETIRRHGFSGLPKYAFIELANALQGEHEIYEQFEGSVGGLFPSYLCRYLVNATRQAVREASRTNLPEEEAILYVRRAIDDAFLRNREERQNLRSHPDEEADEFEVE